MKMLQSRSVDISCEQETRFRRHLFRITGKKNRTVLGTYE